MEKPIIVIRKSFAEKVKQQEQELITIADLSLLVDRLKEQLIDCTDRKQALVLHSELKFARSSLNQAIARAARVG